MKSIRTTSPKMWLQLPAVMTVLWLGLVATLTIVQATAAEDASGRHSLLWGRDGEVWTPQSRLPDFSFAGYRRGERSLPSIVRGVSVVEFGAKGDGEADDTQAFLAAIAKVERGAIEVPAGRYRITNLLEISRPGVVLRGEGPDRSVLVFATPLNDIRPNWGATTTGRRTSNYSWSGGFVTLRGSFGSDTLARVVQPARRGEDTVEVDSTSRLRPGQEVEVYEADTPENSLAIHLYSGDAGPVKNLEGKARASLVARIVAIDGPRVKIDRTLRCDLRPEWMPRLRAFEPTVTESGVEGLSFEFPVTPYLGHFTELGLNPVALSGVAHCWVRNILVQNADSGPFIGGVFNTVEGCVLESERAVDRQRCTGHHGISLGGSDNLLTGFVIRTRFIHDVTVSGFCSGNVASRGRGIDLSLDHHRYAPNENLFTDLDAGAGTRLWKCGGGADLGKHCGTRGTFWNIRAASPLRYPPPDFGPATMNLVGLETNEPSETDLEGKWFEVIAPAELAPRDLHEAQRARRLGRAEAPPVPAPLRSTIETVEVERDISYAETDNPRQRLDLFLPKKRSSDRPLPVIAYIHGGAWMAGDRTSGGGVRPLAELVAGGDFAGVSIGYRLSQEAPWPAQIHDCKAAIRWLRANSARLGLDADRIGVIGESAGGHLVALLGTGGGVAALEGDLGSNDETSSRVRCVVDQFGPSELLVMSDYPSRMDHNAPDSPESRLVGGPLQERKEAARAASPITYVSSDDPPFLIIHGDADPLVPFNQSERLAKALKDAGVEPVFVRVEGGGHGGFRNPELPERIRRFFERHLRGQEVEVSAEAVPNATQAR